jgi:NADPH-dependent 2,4-dienoyl-CoA reductase/sulfur reductase-like enzyme/nitrite reductase/ring-hydroxylating ferredoxin subunit
MAEMRVLDVGELPLGTKKVVTLGETAILLIHHDDGICAVQAKCPHAGAPLEKGAICNGHLVCPWHMGTFALATGKVGELLEPPPMEPLKTYPLRIDGHDMFVDSEPIPQVPEAKASAQTPVFLLVGAGAAGAMAARTLRLAGFTGRIVAVDPVAGEPVDRTQLTKNALAGKMPLEKTALGTLEKDGVERITGSVTHLSAAKSEVTLNSGETLAFDGALVATGGTPKRLDIPGAEQAFTIRHTADVKKLLEAAEGNKKIVVLGTSFIGLEAASALTQKGFEVTVVGKEKLPFAKKFGDEAAIAIKGLHLSKGTKFRLGVEILRIEDEQVVVSQDGKEVAVPADLVVMGVGVSPELGFAHDLPLAEKGGGIAVDSTLLAAGKVWVGGDIASVEGTRIEHWRLAEQHGQLAAHAMLGHAARYDGVPFFWTTHFGKRFGYLGHAQDWDEIVTDGDVAALTFFAFYVKAGKVEAVLSCGRDTENALLAEVMRSKPTLDEVRKAIAV